MSAPNDPKRQAMAELTHELIAGIIISANRFAQALKNATTEKDISVAFEQHLHEVLRLHGIICQKAFVLEGGEPPIGEKRN